MSVHFKTVLFLHHVCPISSTVTCIISFHSRPFHTVSVIVPTKVSQCMYMYEILLKQKTEEEPLLCYRKLYLNTHPKVRLSE